jgi:ankyrin repeat protein
MFGADADVVAYLTRKYPGAAKKVDKLGMLPLHIACDSDIGIDSPNWSVVEVLAEACPEACLTKCEYGATPLAICVARKAPIPVLEALIKACPEALSEADKENHIPLQSALTANASLDVIRLLVDNYPNGLLTENSDNETPFDFGVRMDLDSVILDVLATKKKSC